MNDCLNGTDNCDVHATCTNTVGSFQCACDPGYTGDGVTCTPVLAVSAVSAGGAFTCALLTTGKVRCWGYSGQGRLGYGNLRDIGDNETPASVGDVDVGGSVQQIVTGAYNACALLTTGAVRCWGYGLNGELGYGNPNDIGDDETPASAGDVAVGGPVKQIAAGLGHTCALLTTGAVRCWGHGGNGQLGYGNTKDIGYNETPASAGDVAVGGPVKQIVAGTDHTCALLTTGAVRCWGHGGSGKLGYGNANNIGDDETPAAAGDVPVGGAARQIVTNFDHNCALLTTGALRCWGFGPDGELGYGNRNSIGDNETPASAGDVLVGGAVQQVAVGSSHSCALLTTGTLRCWGYGRGGWLGYGNTNSIGDDEAPASAGDVPVF